MERSSRRRRGKPFLFRKAVEREGPLLIVFEALLFLRSRAALLWQVAGVILVLSPMVVLPWTGEALGAGRVQEFLPTAPPGEFFPGADRFGPPQGDPPTMPAYRSDRLVGHVFLNSDFTNSAGYSGKPIHLLVGFDPNGLITKFKLVDRKEPTSHRL